MNIRIYVRSVHKTILNQWQIFYGLKDLLLNLVKIRQQKIKLGTKLNLSKEKLEKKQELIKSKNIDSTAQNINFIR